VNSKEPRYILRVLRALASTRKRLNEDVIRRLILFYYGVNSSEREILLGFAHSVSQVCLNEFKKKSFIVFSFVQPMDVDMEKPSTPAPVGEKQVTSRPQTSRARAAALPEVDLYIHLIVLLYLIDRNSLKSVGIIFLEFHLKRICFVFFFFNSRHLIVLNDLLIKRVYLIVEHLIFLPLNVIFIMQVYLN